MTLRYLLRRLLQALIIVVLVTVVVFALVNVVPGDPAFLILGDGATPEAVAALRTQMGLDEPLWIQYFEYMSGILQGDFGTSVAARLPVWDVIRPTLVPTAILIGAAVGLAIVVGIPLGILAGIRRGTAIDRGALVVALAGQSIPAFWLGLILISVVAFRMGLLPTSGYGTPRHLILPAVALAPTAMGMLLRVTRIGMIESLGEDYILTARAKGARAGRVYLRHALKNAAIPVVTIVGLQIGALLGGAIITETVFAWPGIGRLAVNALIARDWPVVRTIVLFVAVGLVFINIVVDLVYAHLDKRVRFG
ncbi:MAG: ABC transporter permease [Acidimicrobiia bacterium]|nr:ABC transporter permease [bacterium]MXX63824.1 ABC transporter permease [Acidimicrobiia bacterium]MCY3579293.1 ABC transporter permease [bacterium]MCY3651784.1 ABC transporter permease [bacterium]MDE0643492.1 ABC transporter permease [bacterium]